MSVCEAMNVVEPLNSDAADCEAIEIDRELGRCAYLSPKA